MHPSGNKEVTGEISDLIGRVGRWHLIILAVIFTNSVFNAYGQLGMAFMLPPGVAFNCSEPQDPGWWKKVPKHSNGYCQKLKAGVISECEHWSFDRSTHQSTILEEWNLVCQNDYLKPFPQAVSMAGLIVGNVIFSAFSDHYGRRPALFLGLVLCAVSALVATVTSDFVVFNASRFVLSISKIGIQASIVIYLEGIKPSYRWMFPLLNGIGFHLGMLAVSVTAYHAQSWRYLQGLTIGPAVAVLPLMFFLWESPRWLLSQKRIDEGVAVLERICRLNRIPRSQIDLHMPAIRRKYNQVAPVKPTSPVDLLRKSASSGKAMASKTLVMWYLCFTNGLLLYSATFASTSLGSSPHVSFCVPIFSELIAVTLVAVAVKFMRRKLIVFITSILGAFGYYLMAFTEQLESPEGQFYARMGSLIIVRSASAAFAQIHPVYSAEMYPTPLRNVGIGFCDLMYRVASTVDPFGRYYLPKIGSNLLPLLYASMSLLGAILTLLLPETMNKALDDGLVVRLSRRMSELAIQIRKAGMVFGNSPSAAARAATNRKRPMETTIEEVSEVASTRF